jgi:hypothetical protein
MPAGRPWRGASPAKCPKRTLRHNTAENVLAPLVPGWFRLLHKGDINMTKLVAAALAAALVMAGLPSVASATCGTRGGPGLRGPDGRCQSWAQVGRSCGTDGSRCEKEQVSPYFKQLPNEPTSKLMQCAHGQRTDCQQ